MKKSMLVTLVMAFLIFMASSYGSAQVTGVADISKEGSLVIWPLVQTFDNYDTYIIITNGDGNFQDYDVSIKCYWEYKESPFSNSDSCQESDVIFTLTKHDPHIFRASDGVGLDGSGVVAPMGPNRQGALKCFVVDPTGDKQISWNHLSGYGIIVDQTPPSPSLPVPSPKKTAMEYSAVRFAANVVTIADNNIFADGFWVGDTTPDNTMYLYGAVLGGVVTDPTKCPNTTASTHTVPIQVKWPLAADPSHGLPAQDPLYYCVNAVDQSTCQSPYDATACALPKAVYDACPAYLTFDFLSEPSTPNCSSTNPSACDGYAYNTLTLLPCDQDLTDDSALARKTKLMFYVWNENEVKYTGQYQCATCEYVGGLGSMPLGFFMTKNLHTASGRFRVQGLAGCGGTATPLLGLMTSKILKYGSTVLNDPDIVGTTPTFSGGIVPANNSNTNTAKIRWTPMGPVYSAPRR